MDVVEKKEKPELQQHLKTSNLNNTEDSEKNEKTSDAADSNSCSNSQSKIQSHENDKNTMKMWTLSEMKVDETGSDGEVVGVKELEPIFAVPHEQPNDVEAPKEELKKPIPFMIHHGPDGHLMYIDPKSVPYLGYLLEDIKDNNIVQLFHPDDLLYLKEVYECIVREGSVPRSKTYRMLARNGSYVKLETEWSSFTNPTSKKLEFVIGKHHVIEDLDLLDKTSLPQDQGQSEILSSADIEKTRMLQSEEEKKIQALRESIIKVMNDVPTMETLTMEVPKPDDDKDLTGIAEHDRENATALGLHYENDYYSSNIRMLPEGDYDLLNYNENLKRYFNSQQFYYDNKKIADDDKRSKPISNKCKSLDNHSSGDPKMNLCGVSSTDLQDAHSSRMRQRLLTVAALDKHTIKAELKLVKYNRESSRVFYDSLQEVKDHLARCNAAYHPTEAEDSISSSSEKSQSDQEDSETTSIKPICSSPHQLQPDEQVLSLGTPESVSEDESQISNTCSSYDSIDMMDGESSDSSSYSSNSSDSVSSKDNKKLELTDGLKNQGKTFNERIWFQDSYWEKVIRSSHGNHCVGATRKVVTYKPLPWVDLVDKTTRQLYRDQITPKPLSKVLAKNKAKLSSTEESPTVAEQLEQLKKELELEREILRLILEDDTSTISSSSSEDEHEDEARVPPINFDFDVKQAD